MIIDNNTGYVHEDITLLIIKPHPHAGELCHPVGATKETITEQTWGVLVELVDCPHGVDRCYALKENMQMICRGDRGYD